ncbi:MAG TPA: hypothetical protein VKQ05_12885 [Gemmatimonadales bacterium]|nr:hypothetical protein [Gemmatimonadales bacterium]
MSLPDATQGAAADASRDRRLANVAVDMDQLTPEFLAARTAEASNYNASMDTLAAVRAEQKRTHNESVGRPATGTAAPLKK